MFCSLYVDVFIQFSAMGPYGCLFKVGFLLNFPTFKVDTYLKLGI